MSKQELKSWISNYFDMNITENTVFFKDIPFSDIDLDCFIVDFMKKFEIDSELFNISDYTLEGVSYFKIWFKGKRAKTFNIEHLLKVIELKKWYDPSDIDKIFDALTRSGIE